MILKKLIAILILITLGFPVIASASVEYNYILDERHNRIPIPVAYQFYKSIDYLGPGFGEFRNPKDIFIDHDGNLYVADTGSDRIVKLTSDGTILGSFTGPEDYPLNSPEGIFVDNYGNMFIADTGNRRIVHLSADGEFIEEFTKPTDDLYDATYDFRPTKLYIGHNNMIYMLNKDSYHGIVILDAYNRFHGYLSPVQIGFSLRDLLIRTFATEAQKEQLARRLPPAHSNLTITEDGMIYTTTLRANYEQIRRLTIRGRNVFDRSFFGERFNEQGEFVEPAFVDLTVDENGIISALDAAHGKIYQYDSDGNLLAVFGGTGNWDGKFILPSSIENDYRGNIFVLDEIRNNIQIFAPTRFMNTVHNALKLYHEGKYEQAVEPWEMVLKMAPNYVVAHKGMGEAYMKQGRWEIAMESFKAAEYEEGYSRAFSEYRHYIFREYFGWVMLGVIAILYLIVRLVGIVIRTGRKYINNTKTWEGAY